MPCNIKFFYSVHHLWLVQHVLSMSRSIVLKVFVFIYNIINLKVFNLKPIILISKNKKLTIFSKNIFFNMENHNES